MQTDAASAEEDDVLANEVDFEKKDPAATANRFRRKSTLPVDESVLNELSQHRSLEDVIASPVGAAGQVVGGGKP